MFSLAEAARRAGAGRPLAKQLDAIDQLSMYYAVNVYVAMSVILAGNMYHNTLQCVTPHQFSPGTIEYIGTQCAINGSFCNYTRVNEIVYFNYVPYLPYVFILAAVSNFACSVIECLILRKLAIILLCLLRVGLIKFLIHAPNFFWGAIILSELYETRETTIKSCRSLIPLRTFCHARFYRLGWNAADYLMECQMSNRVVICLALISLFYGDAFQLLTQSLHLFWNLFRREHQRVT
jgi:hypothetical protein